MNSTPQPLRRVAVERYVTPLREGGSLPAVVEALSGVKLEDLIRQITRPFRGTQFYVPRGSR